MLVTRLTLKHVIAAISWFTLVKLFPGALSNHDKPEFRSFVNLTTHSTYSYSSTAPSDFKHSAPNDAGAAKNTEGGVSIFPIKIKVPIPS